ncbi:class I SAM-dependent methyltransferase [Pseudomonas sichuanensis]|uniref:class I SAM-dependent methyltransferase n=1 Tax=Pseudomonas sichuanensis TaxID=2213015 RepID=UPI00216043BA|nr:class I SAM-dependent methyltransferase [Pseudomonas sichuanensis]UVL89035.1 class I SAM-dependent methyltransferase [Pseudomonas sichuanensis]
MKVCLKCAHAFSSDGWGCPVCHYEPARLNGFDAHAEEFANGGGGFNPEYFEELASLEAANFWFRARNELILWALKTYKPDAHSLLEVGCGTGFVLSGIAQKHPQMALSGSEIFLTGLSHAAARVPTAQFMQMDARHVPFFCEFDVIGAFDVLEHIEEDESVLTQLHKALKPTGVLLLTVPQHPWLWSANDDYACHVRRYTARELHKKVTDAGFRIERSTSFVSLLLPAMMLSRRASGVKSIERDVTAELRLSRTLNNVFLSMMRIEQRLIRSGVNFTLGGSRLVVARKNA